MDEEIQRVQLQKAIGILEEAREEEAGHAQILYLLMRCSLRLEDVDRAERYFREWAEAVTPEAARPWRMEILYKRRDWAELRREMRAFAQAAEINPRLKQIADFWLQEEGVLA
ncbi:MAG: tetratricopeptide repeat protein [Opitutales bacterium]